MHLEIIAMFTTASNISARNLLSARADLRMVTDKGE
jgi:hypothetical protein